jgi:hypothetical protein
MEEAASSASSQEQDAATLYYDLLRACFADTHGVPPFLTQDPENNLEFFVCPLPGWHPATNKLSFDHFHVTGCARVHSGGGDNDQGEQSGFAMFCTCCAQGQQAWHEIQLFHDVSGECSTEVDCIHAKTLGKIAAHFGFDTMMCAGRSAGACAGMRACVRACVRA